MLPFILFYIISFYIILLHVVSKQRTGVTFRVLLHGFVSDSQQACKATN